MQLDLATLQPEPFAQIRRQQEWRFVGGPDVSHTSQRLQFDQTYVRLEVRLMLDRSTEGVLEHQLDAGERRAHLRLRRAPRGCGNSVWIRGYHLVAHGPGADSRRIVDNWSGRLHGLEWIEDGRELLVFDLDQCERFVGDLG